MVITMSNNCCLFSGISRRFHGNGTHPRQTLIDTSCLIQLDDHAFICTHNRLDVQRSGKKRLKSGKTAILPKSIQSLQNKIGMHLSLKYFQLLHNLFKRNSLLL